MTTVDIPLARRDIIAERLRQGSAVTATQLAIEFSVSEDAIRRDLRALAADGLCRRVYGGALPIRESTPMVQRVTEQQAQKAKLAQAGAASITPGEFIFLDSGSTNLALVSFLPQNYGLTVATNSIVIAAALLPRTDIRLIVLGGGVTHQVGGCVDTSAVLQVARMTIDRAFIGACAVSISAGIGAVDLADATFKHRLIHASQHSVVLATNDKFALRAPHQIAALHELDQLIVEHDLPSKALEELRLFGIAVTRAKE